jgi:hypothetical protein
MSDELSVTNLEAGTAGAELPVNGGAETGTDALLVGDRLGGRLSGGLLGPLEFPFPEPVPNPSPFLQITSVQPSQLRAARTTTVTVTGFNLPSANASYSVVDFSGVRVPGILIALRSFSPSQVILDITVPPTVLSGSYFLRAAVVGAAAQSPIQIVDAGVLRLDSIQPNRIRAGASTTVVARGNNLPVNAGNYSVVGRNGAPVPGVFVVEVSGTPLEVRVEILASANAPLGTAFLQVSITGATAGLPLEIFQQLGIVIFSLSSNQLTAGQTTRVTVTGSNLPPSGTAYSVQGPSGNIGAQIVWVFASIDQTTGKASSVTLDITIPPSTPAGPFYRLRAQDGTFAAEAPVQIVQPIATALRISSVQPSTLRAGSINTVMVTGSGLPATAASYAVVTSFGTPASGVQVLSAFGGGSSVTLQISVSAFTPTGGYRLRVVSQGQVAEFPINIFGRILVAGSETPVETA